MKPDDEYVDWLFGAIRLWFTRCASLQGMRDNKPILLLPTKEHFPASDANMAETCLDLFDLVIAYAGFADIPVKMVLDDSFELENTLLHLGAADVPRLSESPDNEPKEIPDHAPREVVITVDDLVAPTVFVATVARDLSHYAMPESNELPGGDSLRPAYIDIGAVCLGFGIFLANGLAASRRFDQRGERRNPGALDDHQLGYALALFTLIFGIPARLVKKHLQANAWSGFKKGLRHLKKHHSRDIEALRHVELSPSPESPYR